MCHGKIHICDHGPQNGHMGELFLIEIYTSHESGINKLCYDRTIFEFSKIWNLTEQKKSKYGEIAFKVVQMKSFAMHITNQLKLL